MHRELPKVYGDAARNKTMRRDWFCRFKDGDFDVVNRPREGRPKTFEDAELETLLDEDSCQTREELTSALGVTRQAISKWLHALGMIKKQGTWVPYDLKPRDIECRFFACEQLLQRQKRKGFLHRIVAGYEKWIYYSNPNRRKSWDCPVMLLRRRLGRIFTLPRLCCIFGGTRSVLFIMSCWNRTKPSLGNGIERNWCVWAQHCMKNGHNTSRGTENCFYSMTLLDLTLPNPLKSTWKR